MRKEASTRTTGPRTTRSQIQKGGRSGTGSLPRRRKAEPRPGAETHGHSARATTNPARGQRGVQDASLRSGAVGEPVGLSPDDTWRARGYGAHFGFGVAAVSPSASFTSEELVRRSNYWRDNYNPLRGLSIARLMALFEQAERGAFAEIQLTLRKAEKRFPVLKGFIEKLLSSVEELEGKVRVKLELPAGGTPEMAEKQRQFLQGRYDLLRNFKSSIGQLALADLRGYAVLQKHRYPEGRQAGAVEELYWLEPWCWARDGFYGDFYYNEGSQLGVGLGNCQAILGEDCRVGGGQLPRADFVVREAEWPLYEIALIAFVNWLMGRRDYSSFVEIFGLPNSVVILPPSLPGGMEVNYQVGAEKVARGVSGTLPAGSDVKFPAESIRGGSPYEAFCNAQEKDVVLAGTAGHLTMLGLPTGIGKGASEEHDEAWRKIALAKAARINDTLQRDFDAPELAQEFPDEPICVHFALALKDSEEVGELLDNVVKAEGCGLQVDPAEISERSGLKLTRPAPGSAGVSPAPPAGGTPALPGDPIAGLAAKMDRRVDRREITGALYNRSVADVATSRQPKAETQSFPTPAAVSKKIESSITPHASPT